MQPALRPTPLLRGRTRAAALILALGASLAACDDPPKKGDAPAASTSAPAPAETVAAAPTATTPPKPRQMPPRPVPLGSSGPIQPSSPPEQQMMVIQYTLAMVAPQPTDPLVDKAYIDAMIPKLAAAARTADKGKTPPDPVQTEKGNRELLVNMGKGCTDRTPSNLLAQRAGSSLKAAYDAGVLVISCRDDKWKCHQSTRDPKDVLCHAAPR